MNILFGEVSGEYLQERLNEDSPILVCEEKFYDFGINMQEDTFTLFDTLGRAVPIGVHEFEAFYQAVKIARNYAKALVKADNILDIVRDNETLTVCG